jgi:hypothetical protein
MIVKESIGDEEPYEEQGNQRKLIRSSSWYRKAFIDHGFIILDSKFHSRIHDGDYGFNDEEMFCLQPIPYTVHDTS